MLTFVDVTSLRAAEREANRLSAIVRSAREAILSKALDGRILSWNAGAEHLYGYTEEEAVGRHISLVVPEERTAEIDAILAATAKGVDVPPFETVRVAKDGTARHVLLSVAPIRSKDGEVTSASVIALDVTDRKLAEERALIAVEQRDRFLALLSHELRNPLMAMATANELLLCGRISDEIASRAKRTIARQIARMSRLLEDTLDASRTRLDKIELERRGIDLRDVLEAALDVARPHAGRTSVRLTAAMPAEPVRVQADFTRFQQVFVSLLLNAINHSHSGQRVIVSLAVREGDAVVEVADEGRGIAPEILPRLFEPFFQGARSNGSLGLGLSLAQAVVRAHGGTIAAMSRGIGTGATFQVRLPVAPDDAPETSADPRPPARNGGTESTIVLVDDDRYARENLGILLRDAGYRVYEAATAGEGLGLIRAHRPAVAVVDIGLPDLSGLEIARRIRAEHGPTAIRLIALTGFGQQSDRDAAVQSGFDMHLVKPIAFATLENVIAHQIGDSARH